MTVDNDAIFETEVRRIANIRWPSSQEPKSENFIGRERDAVIITDDIVHIIEATNSRLKSKAEIDIQKSIDLAKSLKAGNEDKVFRIWFITSEDPTSDQNSVVKIMQSKFRIGKIEAQSYKLFCSKIIDGSKYLQLRQNYYFGSIRNPANESDYEVPLSSYIDLKIFERKSNLYFSTHDITAKMLENRKELDCVQMILLGEYGSGKSMTLRHVFHRARVEYLRGRYHKFPLYINLREHFGQDDPTEALHRHARRIGFEAPESLIAGWRAGFVDVFLDGFDELSSTQIVRGTAGLRKARFLAMALVRNFVDQTPNYSKILIAGRENYFDNEREMCHSLGINDNALVYATYEFDSDQIKEYLLSMKIDTGVPDWLPARPLLLGYLAVRGFLQDASFTPNIGGSKFISEEEGWDYLIGQIYQREAKQIEPDLIDTYSVREFIEKLASKARSSASGLGPIHNKDIDDIFQNVFGVRPNERTEAFMLRLPGFTSSPGKDDEREFIDVDFVDACAAGDVFRYIEDPFNFDNSMLSQCNSELGDLGLRVLSHQTKDLSDKKIEASFTSIHKKEEQPYLSYDIFRLILMQNRSYNGEKIYFDEGLFKDMELDTDMSISNVEFSNCYFSEFEALITRNRYNKISFRNCSIINLVGPASEGEFRSSFDFLEGEIENMIDETATNAGVMEMSAPLGLRVLITVLRKIFIQKGKGRKDTALYRGLGQSARAKVDEVISLVQKHDFAHPYKRGGPTVWIPNRDKASTALKIIDRPQNVKHPIVKEAETL